jgi:hypothetical protein
VKSFVREACPACASAAGTGERGVAKSKGSLPAQNDMAQCARCIAYDRPALYIRTSPFTIYSFTGAHCSFLPLAIFQTLSVRTKNFVKRTVSLAFCPVLASTNRSSRV